MDWFWVLTVWVLHTRDSGSSSVLLVFTSVLWAAPHLRYKLLHVIRLVPLCNLPLRICLRTEDAQRSNMKLVGGIILILSFAVLASGKHKTTKSTFFLVCVCVFLIF